ncbi:E3 ubiquitin-protein ligase synoviolin [Marchantia polymorpha subsp. ruderalis]|nr:hypothetical protein MARPO_0075s0067 [Marchantia polymorpha]BBN00912.1 hypothetical protein Mp_2g03060 [Marchantia polymorpha subsp. ruderalis]|eukprot:PTQ34966.1 hypothetical protein MARPO_0075s0067 [Marchantia polymorpha]
MVSPGTYAAVSAACAVAVIYHAVSTRRQFYPVMLYLSHSKISLLFLLNMGFVMMCGLWQLVNMIFLGPLRETEVERLNEQVWREVMEILFAMTVFREEFSLYFMFLITVLLFMKAHHWLAQKRVEYIETTPSVPTLSHVRLCTFMALLLTLDCLFFHRSFSHLLKTREASVSLFFAFEYTILVSTTIGTFIKYALHMGDTYMEGRFTGKAVCLFYLELVQDLLHLSLYLLFFLVIFMNYGLPLHLVRELYETFRNFKNRIADYLRYRRLTYNMNERFADANAEDLIRDATCIVCREDMVEAKKLPCGHLFHIHCLRQWLERQNTCPTCRAPVLGPDDEPSIDQLEEEQFENEVQAEEGEIDFTPENAGENADGNAEYNVEPAVENATNWSQVHAAATTAAANYGSSFLLPVLSRGYSIWYPMLLPSYTQAHTSGQANMDVTGSGEELCNVASSLTRDTFCPALMVNVYNQHNVLQRWIWKHNMVQTAELFSQLQQNAMQPCFLPHASSSASPLVDPNSSSRSLIREQQAEDAQNNLHPSCANSDSQNDVQLTYLRGVSEILERHLQHCVELQHQIGALTLAQPSSISRDTKEDSKDGSTVFHLRELNEESESRSRVELGDTAASKNDSLSLSTNPLYNTSLPSSSSSSTGRADT